MMSMKRTVMALLAVAGAAVGEVEYTEVEFKSVFHPELEVVAGALSESCTKLLAAGNYKFKVPAGWEKLFMTYYKAACGGVGLKAKVMQTYNPQQHEACTGKPNTLKFTPNNQLGMPVLGETYSMTVSGVTACSNYPAAGRVYLDGTCAQGMTPYEFGANLGGTDTTAMMFVKPETFGRNQLIVDYGNCTFESWLSVTDEETQIFWV